MHTIELFRHKLIHRLNRCAADRRQACAEVPTGEDLKIIALFDRLARESDHFDPDLSAEVEQALADPVRARGLRQALEDLPASIGFSVWHRDGASLVRWMLVQASPPDPIPLASRRSRIAAGGTGTASERRRLPVAGRTSENARPDLFRSVAREFTGGISVVGPLVAVWEIASGARQWRDHAFAASHPGAAATIVAVKAEAGTRSFMPTVAGTISFRPSAGSDRCNVPVRLDTHSGSFEVGQSIAIVPRSGDCEAPLIATQIGDPSASFICAILFLIAGLAALKAWLWLWKSATPLQALWGTVRSIAL
ncbi:hypothetical protein [Lichenifustis flavocetrariae]|uniref:Uncharacterized protein n=1 Tax=Lichenifustis flavocetrariae TaxID=2949735 RepID=A0AA42CPX0_9HYPH|nr:hypothetical protein [Lichenifustis flavocetrariae]MCW6510850.1 hypothetical protein [Lichenifustis flavocetrariae]